MSATRPRAVDPATEQARDLTDLYVVLIHESCEVCSNCHETIRDKETHDTNSLGTSNRPDATLTRIGSGLLGYEVETHDRYGVIRTHTPKTYCGSCGQPGGKARDDTPSKEAMLDAVPELVERLREASIPANADLLERLVGHLRSQPEYRGSETEIWRAATALAVENARIRDCVRATYGRGP